MYIALLVFLCAFCQRALVVRRVPVGFDTYGHLYYTREVKEQRAGPFGEIALRVVGSTKFRHPFLWHWAFGKLPTSFLFRTQRWINPVLDAAFVAVAYEGARKAGVSQHDCVLGALLYLSTPLWFSSVSTGPRLASLTPRLTSEIATNLFFIFSVVPLNLAPGWRSLLVVVLAAFVLLSSKFGLQALLFLTPAVALSIRSASPVAELIGGITLALIATRGRFVKTAASQLDHLNWYFRKNLRGEMTPSGRNDLRKFFSGTTPRQRLRSAVVNIIAGNSYSVVLVKLPILTIVLWGAVFTSDHVHTWLIGPVYAGVAVFCLINWRPLLFLGEAERYLNHLAFFIVGSAVVVARDPSLEPVIFAALFWGALYWTVECLLYRRRTNPLEAIESEVIATLSTLPRSMTVLVYPFTRLGIFRVLLQTHHRVIDTMNAAPEFRKRFETEFAEAYPYVNLAKLDEMAVRFSLDAAVISLDDLRSRGLSTWRPSSQWSKLAVGAPAYAVYVRDCPVAAQLAHTHEN